MFIFTAYKFIKGVKIYDIKFKQNMKILIKKKFKASYYI